MLQRADLTAQDHSAEFALAELVSGVFAQTLAVRLGGAIAAGDIAGSWLGAFRLPDL
jgi:hypothetical protein